MIQHAKLYLHGETEVTYRKLKRGLETILLAASSSVWFVQAGFGHLPIVTEEDATAWHRLCNGLLHTE